MAGEAYLTTRDKVRLLRRQQTPAEARHWSVFRRHQLDGLQFRRQYSIGVFIADVFCAGHRLVVEVDGPIHSQPDYTDHDANRDGSFLFSLSV